MDLDEWQTMSTPEGEWSVRVSLEDQRQHLRNVAKQARLETLENYTPKQRREAYRDPDLKVQARPEGGIAVSGVFGERTLYITGATSPELSVIQLRHQAELPHEAYSIGQNH